METNPEFADRRGRDPDHPRKTVAVIPARGNSKEIPRKNLAVIGKWSLLEHTIADAYELKCPIYVSTEDNQIGFVAQEADAIFVRRPWELAEDHISTEAVVIDVLERLSVPPEATVVLLQCTSPFRHPGELKDALEYFEKGFFDSLYSAYRLYQFAWSEEERLLDPVGTRPIRQMKQPIYIEDGSFYISYAWCYYRHHNRLAGRIGRWVHDKVYGIEVDTLEDLEQCQQLLKWLTQSGKV